MDECINHLDWVNIAWFLVLMILNKLLDFLYFSHIWNGQQFFSYILSKKQRKATKKAWEKYQKKKNRQYGCEVWENLPENEKKKGWLSIEKVIIKCGKTLCNNFQTHIKTVSKGAWLI